jgi:lysophospholipase L1-like esterase
VTFGFQNFGIAGESTDSMINGGNRQLDRAIERVNELVNDGNPDTNVHVITIAMGANDIFPVLQGVECSADPLSEACQTALDAAVAVFGVNIEQIFSRLRAAAGPDIHIIVMTYYNPFNFGTGLVFEDVSDATVNELNTQIHAASGLHNIAIAPANDLYRGLSAALTHILVGDIHPNDDGYRVLLRAFQDAYEGVGPF